MLRYPRRSQDMSVEAQKMVELIQSLNQAKTANYVLSVWHGSKNQQSGRAGHPHHISGIACSWPGCALAADPLAANKTRTICVCAPPKQVKALLCCRVSDKQLQQARWMWKLRCGVARALCRPYNSSLKNSYAFTSNQRGCLMGT
eukprot:1137554-Pelagomonas_calceolata.AAC.9